MSRIIREATGYAGASALALGVDFLLLSLQVSILHFPYLAAAAISFTVGTIVVYWASIHHIFSHRRLADWRHEFAIFAVLGFAGLVVNLVAMYGFVDGLGLHYLLAKVGASGFTFVTNFLLRRQLLFTPQLASGANREDRMGSNNE
jgi:putative flippase GtrA